MCVVVVAACVSACTSPPAAAPSSAPSSAAPSTVARTTPHPTTVEVTDTLDPGDLGSTLPGDLTPNVVEDECLLTASEFDAMLGTAATHAENTELAGSGGRSCFYAAIGADEPDARIDVYASTALPPTELVARIIANGGRALTTPAAAPIGAGAVTLNSANGATELVVASPGLLAVLTLLPGLAIPSDEALATAGLAMASRMPY